MGILLCLESLIQYHFVFFANGSEDSEGWKLVILSALLHLLEEMKNRFCDLKSLGIPDNTKKDILCCSALLLLEIYHAAKGHVNQIDENRQNKNV